MRSSLRRGLLIWVAIGLLFSLVIALANFLPSTHYTADMTAGFQWGATVAGLERTLVVSTDIASFYLYHPDDLAHRRADPPGWVNENFAIGKEFTEGNLVAFGTGADWGFPIRVTAKSLTEDEQQHVTGSLDYRLQVRHGRVYLDGGDALPDGGYRLPNGRIDLPPLPPDYFPERWIALPNGAYRVTVFTFDWEDAQGTDRPSYTFLFQSVDNLEAIEPPPSFPELHEGAAVFYHETEASDQPSTPFEQRVVAVLPWSEVVFPEFEATFYLPQTQYQQFKRAFDGKPEPEFAVSVDPKPQTLATLVGLRMFRESSPTMAEATDYIMNGEVALVVRLLRTFEEDGLLWAEVEPYEPPVEAASSAQVTHLKSLFASYAERDRSYPQRVAYPGFYAEQVAAMDAPRLLGWYVANALVLPKEDQQDLLTLSDHDLIQRLVEILISRQS